MSALAPQNDPLHDAIFSYLQSEFGVVISTLSFLNVRTTAFGDRVYSSSGILNADAALVFLVDDYFLTLDEEILYVWTKSRRNLATVLFFAVRYLVFIPAGLAYHMHANTPHSIAMEDCKAWTNAAAYSQVGMISIIEIVLGLRAWALWDRSKKVALCLGLTVLVLVVIGLHKVATIQGTQTAFSVDFYNISGRCPPQFSGKDGDSGSDVLSTGFMMIVAYESVVLVLTLIQAYRQGCERNQKFWSYIFQGFRHHWSSSRFIDSFISQGVAYNCITLVTSTANIICRYKLPSAYVNILVDFQLAIHAILVSRMLLYIRKQSHRRSFGSSSGWTSLSGLVVAPNSNLPLVDPGTSCPQITFLNLGSPLSYECERPKPSPKLTGGWDQYKVE
ncbi:hypothetical protein PM082_013451 [Marasmius tenuissimus]|nr:hypothetical protein PM082_013451 [Marasmius tenuissimus]